MALVIFSHPTVLMAYLWIHGMYVYMYASK